jgi:mRNA interferase HicA
MCTSACHKLAMMDTERGDGEFVSGAGHRFKCAYICAKNWRPAIPKPALETNRNKVAARLVREGWQVRHGGDHDVYKHPARPGRIILPRHRMLSPGVARVIAKQAGWFD